VKHFLTEFLIVVAGILVALGVDQWRSDRAEIKVANEHLADIADEVRQNLCTVERIRVRAQSVKTDGLQAVLTFLNDPVASVADPATLLSAFAWSMRGARPWLVDNQYQALQNSGNVRLVHKLQPEMRLSSAYEGPQVLFAQVDRMQGRYPTVVSELIPAQLQGELNPLRGYAKDHDAPDFVDDSDLLAAVARIRARREELLGLARGEAAIATANWFALTRIKADLEKLLQKLAQWDRSTQPLPDMLAECVAPNTPGPVPGSTPPAAR
jgi:hypothetical protein